MLLVTVFWLGAVELWSCESSISKVILFTLLVYCIGALRLKRSTVQR